MPEIGDLHDACTVDDESVENFIRHSPDSVEGATFGSSDPGPSSSTGCRRGRSPDTPCTNMNSAGFPPGRSCSRRCSRGTVCEKRTGHFLCELITPQVFEAAVVFERPRWPRLNTERRVMRYALKKIEAGAGRPASATTASESNGESPSRKSAPVTCAFAFHQNGLLLWNDNLQKNPLAGWVRRLGGPVGAGLTAAKHRQRCT